MFKACSSTSISGPPMANHRPFYSSVVSERLLHSMTQRVRGDSRGVRLTGREQEILRLVAEGRRGRPRGCDFGGRGLGRVIPVGDQAPALVRLTLYICACDRRARWVVS